MSDDTKPTIYAFSADDKAMARILGLPEGARVWKVETRINDMGHVFTLTFHVDNELADEVEFMLWSERMNTLIKGDA